MSSRNSADRPDDADQAALLASARVRATALVSHLISEQAKLEANPPKISPEAMAEGRYALEQAIGAGRRTLAALEAAMGLAAQADHRPADGDQAKQWN